LDDALRRYPNIWELEQYRAEILQATKGPDAALPEVAAFAARNWWHIESRMTLSRLHIAAGDYAAALEDCREAATLDIHSAAPYEQAARADLLRARGG
jgi:hypothetical protein